MKTHLTRRVLGLSLAAAVVGSMAVTSAVTVSASVTSRGIENSNVGIVGSFNEWGNNGKGDVPMYDKDGDGIWEGIIDIPNVTPDMIWEATRDDGVGNQVPRGINGIVFKVRLDGGWTHAWGDYEPGYDRTWNSQTNCAVPATSGQPLKIKVTLNTTTVEPESETEEGDEDAWYVWPVRYEVIDPLVNTSVLSDNEVVLGEPVTVYCTARGGKFPYDVAVYYKQNKQTNWTCLQSYKPVVPNYTGDAQDGNWANPDLVWQNDRVTFIPKAATDYTVRVKFKDKDGTVTNKDLPLKVKKDPYAQLINDSYCEYDSNIKVGDEIQVNCGASLGVAPYQYAVYYKQQSQTRWTCAQSFAKNNRVNITPKAATTYNIRVKAKDAKGTIVNRDFFVKVNKKTTTLINNSSIWYTDSYPVVGQPIHVECAAENVTGTCQYAVYYKQEKQTSWTCAQRLSTNTKVTVTPKAATTYMIRIKAKDGSGKVVNKDHTVLVKKASELEFQNLSSITYTKPLLVGSQVTIHCRSKNAIGDCKYAVYYKQQKQTTWTCAQNYSTNTIVYITPKAATTYDVRVKAKDSKGRIDTKDYTFEATKVALTNVSYMPSYSVVNQPVHISFDAVGGQKPYQYAISYKQPGKSSFVSIKDYSSAITASFTPKTSGYYTVNVKVKDATGKIASKNMKFKVVSSKSQIPALAGTYKFVFSDELLAFISTLPESMQEYYNSMKNAKMQIMENGLVQNYLFYEDGSYDSNFITWNDNFDNTITFSNIDDSYSMTYEVTGNSVKLIDPNDTSIYMAKES